MMTMMMMMMMMRRRSQVSAQRSKARGPAGLDDVGVAADRIDMPAATMTAAVNTRARRPSSPFLPAFSSPFFSRARHHRNRGTTWVGAYSKPCVCDGMSGWS
jgi:hypothetical protein